MGIKWSDIHFGVSPITNSIYIGKSKITKENPDISLWVDRSGDLTNECMYAVSRKLKQEQENREDGKPYAGYEYEDGSKLIWIAPNHEIEVK